MLKLKDVNSARAYSGLVSGDETGWAYEERSSILDRVSQPSVESGSFCKGGLGPPKANHNIIAREDNNPEIAPVWLIDSNNIPKVKIPSRGPPTTPNIVKLAWEKLKIFNLDQNLYLEQLWYNTYLQDIS